MHYRLAQTPFCLSPWLCCPHIPLRPLWELAAGLSPALVQGVGLGQKWAPAECTVSTTGAVSCSPHFWPSLGDTGSTWPGWSSSSHSPLDLLPWAWHQQPLPLLGLQKGTQFPVERAQVFLQSWCGGECTGQQIPRQGLCP